MINIYIKDIFESNLVNKELIKGYSSDEIEKIERLYNIEIKDDLKIFLKNIGRCDGGFLGDDPIILYRKSWSVRAQLLFQINFFNDLQEIGAWDFLNKPFVFSIEEETQYYFLQTSINNEVFHYNENEGKVTTTGKGFGEYLMELKKKYEFKLNKRIDIPCGELIVI